MVENRRVGIKSRETYECPGSLAVLLAHADLESITLERDLMREKARLEPRYAELVYDGLWFSPLKEALDAFMGHAQRFVTGDVRLRLEPGRCFVAGRRADRGLYSHDLATYDASDTFRHEDSAGFVRLWGLSVETWAREQGGPAGAEPSAGGPSRARHDPLARPLRRRTGRRAARVHREPVVRPSPRPRRPHGFARARRRARARRDPHRRRSRGRARRARPRRHRAGRRHLRVRAGRRRHPHRHRTPGHRARGVGGREAAHRPEPQRPGRHRAAPLPAPRGYRRRRARPAPAGGAARLRRRGRRRVPARLHAPAARAAGAARAPLPRALLGVRPRRRTLARRDRAGRRLAARRRRAGRFEPAARSRRHRRRPRLRAALRELPRRGVRPRLRGRGAVRGRAHPGAPVAPGRGDRAVEQRGVRLPPPRRRVQHRLVDVAAEEEPRHRRARPRQGRAVDR